ncbi:hypothetical protein D9Q81_07435 [Candidatus Korarchaeum cryptofilum]|jgi:hypothetical protein|uniref:Uncharacterized protein n=1 Tax=Candidatus Korarchaeum cryptofilum TaxID=498846 RepID=A0A429G1M3_9CREN|nr:hypothetical protein [Candidatus Korarchaeum cryptofilum]RSN67629.1 hypothetical protein D9Q81_07435 [Candidatus Korarchaeum cryptofilum]
MIAEELKPVPDMWGKAEPEWAQEVEAQNLLRKYRMDVGAPSVHPEGPPMTTERDEEYEEGRDESLF